MSNAIDYRHVSILWAAPEHAGDLARLHAGLFAQAWAPASFETLLEHPGSTAFLARVGQPAELAGFIMGQVAADEAEILSLGVHKDHQRRGIARRLVDAMSRAAKKAEVRRLHLEVGQDNAAALGLYQRLGFKETGRRKGYYQRAGAAPEDALTLSLAL
jgi:ribosomal-protein-alanine N-acetyltransferase